MGHCRLPDLPGEGKHVHTVDGLTACGGDSTSTSMRSCLTLTDGTWETSTTLRRERHWHSSWASPSGVILLGGDGSLRTSERIQDDGTSTDSFSLKYSLRDACAINTGLTVVLTGGQYSRTRVSEYSQSGFL